MTVVIDCNEIQTKEDFHRKFSNALFLPGFYGNNLDALHDCLTSLPQKTVLNLVHAQALIGNLGPYGRAALAAIAHAERESPERLTVNML